MSRLTKPALRYKEPLLVARKVKGKFEDVSEQSGPPFHIPRAGRGAAFGDLDNDGFVDVAVNCNRESAVVLKNSGNGNHWLIVKTIGSVSNRDGMGAQLRLVSESGQEQYGLGDDGRKLFVRQRPASPLRIGNRTRPVKLLEISWPSGTRQRFEDVDGDQILTVRRARWVRGRTACPMSGIFRSMTVSSKAAYSRDNLLPNTRSAAYIVWIQEPRRDAPERAPTRGRTLLGNERDSTDNDRCPAWVVMGRELAP